MATSNIFTQLAAQNAQGNNASASAPASPSAPAMVSTGTDGTNGPPASTQSTPNSPTPQNIFTQLAAQNQQGSASQQSVQPATQQPQRPMDTVSAVPDSTMADKVKRWAENVEGDLKYGTDTTGIGHVLKAMGAHGVYSGNSEGVGDFMTSLPLGLLKSTQGAAEVTQPGQRWRGTKDIAGGALQAATLPSMFVAPEGAEAASAGIDAGTTQAAKAVKAVTGKVKAPFDVQSVQPALQQGIRDVLDTVAKEAGVTPSPAASIRDVAGQVSDAIEAKSKGIYQALDKATGGRFQRYDEALRNINQKIRETAGIDEDQETALEQRRNEVETAQAQAFEDAKAAGVDPSLVDKARLTWKQAKALTDLDGQLKMSTEGMRPELATPGKSNPETVVPQKAFARLNRLYNSGRLQEALGQEQAKQLVQHANTAFLDAENIANHIKWLKRLGLGAIGAAGYEGTRSVLGSH